MQDTKQPSPYFEFSPEQWTEFSHKKERINLTNEELQKCLAYNDNLSLEQVEKVYMPLSRLLYLYYNRAMKNQQLLSSF